MLLLAGGQGTRLGSSAPKGCYDVGLPSGKSLFQVGNQRASVKAREGRNKITLMFPSEGGREEGGGRCLTERSGSERCRLTLHSAPLPSPPLTPILSLVPASFHPTLPHPEPQIQAERLLKVQRMAQQHAATSATSASDPPTVRLRWYVMTSAFTHQETLSHFEQHSYFGLERDQVRFFQQGFLPCLTEQGGRDTISFRPLRVCKVALNPAACPLHPESAGKP